MIINHKGTPWQWQRSSAPATCSCTPMPCSFRHPANKSQERKRRISTPRGFQHHANSFACDPRTMCNAHKSSALASLMQLLSGFSFCTCQSFINICRQLTRTQCHYLEVIQVLKWNDGESDPINQFVREGVNHTKSFCAAAGKPAL